MSSRNCRPLASHGRTRRSRNSNSRFVASDVKRDSRWRSSVRGGGESACTPDSVQAPKRLGDHPSRPAVARRLQRPTREYGRDHPLPARPCSGWGLPSRPGHPGRWCALTAPFHPYLCPARRRPSAVCSLWHFPAGHPDWVLPSTLPCGVRTFLGPDPPEGGPHAVARPTHHRRHCRARASRPARGSTAAPRRARRTRPRTSR